MGQKKKENSKKDAEKKKVKKSDLENYEPSTNSKAKNGSNATNIAAHRMVDKDDQSLSNKDDSVTINKPLDPKQKHKERLPKILKKGGNHEKTIGREPAEKHTRIDIPVDDGSTETGDQIIKEPKKDGTGQPSTGAGHGGAVSSDSDAQGKVGHTVDSAERVEKPHLFPQKLELNQTGKKLPKIIWPYREPRSAKPKTINEQKEKQAPPKLTQKDDEVGLLKDKEIKGNQRTKGTAEQQPARQKETEKTTEKQESSPPEVATQNVIKDGDTPGISKNNKQESSPAEEVTQNEIEDGDPNEFDKKESTPVIVDTLNAIKYGDVRASIFNLHFGKMGQEQPNTAEVVQQSTAQEDTDCSDEGIPDILDWVIFIIESDVGDDDEPCANKQKYFENIYQLVCDVDNYMSGKGNEKQESSPAEEVTQNEIEDGDPNEFKKKESTPVIVELVDTLNAIKYGSDHLPSLPIKKEKKISTRMETSENSGMTGSYPQGGKDADSCFPLSLGTQQTFIAEPGVGDDDELCANRQKYFENINQLVCDVDEYMSGKRNDTEIANLLEFCYYVSGKKITRKSSVRSPLNNRSTKDRRAYSAFVLIMDHFKRLATNYVNAPIQFSTAKLFLMSLRSKLADDQAIETFDLKTAQQYLEAIVYIPSLKTKETLPKKNLYEVLDLNVELSTAERLHEYVKDMAFLPNCSVNVLVHATMLYIMDMNVVTCFNWTGRDGKQSFRSLKYLVKALFMIVSKSFPPNTLEEATFMKSVQSFLRYAGNSHLSHLSKKCHNHDPGEDLCCATVEKLPEVDYLVQHMSHHCILLHEFSFEDSLEDDLEYESCNSDS